ncbi:MAG: hypothetical protein HUJ61_08260 [Bacilli bacterium]|nr:hypothetical protein [Bacilli bacterium]
MKIKKPYNFTILIYLIMLAALYMIGKEIISIVSHGNIDSDNITSFTILTFILGFLANSVLYIIGTVIGAKIGGYNIIAVNLFGIEFAFVNKKLIVHFAGYEGFSGDVKVALNEKKSKHNALPMFLGGFVMMLILIVSAVTYYVVVYKTDYNAIFVCGFLFFATIALALLFYNLLPVRTDSLTDGIKIKSYKKSKESFNELTRIQGELANNQPLKGVKLCEKEITTLNSELYYMAYLENIYAHNYVEAEKIIDQLIESSTITSLSIYQTLLPAKVFTLIKNKTKEEVLAYIETLSQREKQILLAPQCIEGIRCYVALNSYIYDNMYSFNKGVSQFMKEIEKTIYIGNIEQQKNTIIEMVEETKKEKPEWEINY